MMNLYSALLCIAVHPKCFTIICVGGGGGGIYGYIATNIPVLLMTASVVQGHAYILVLSID